MSDSQALVAQVSNGLIRGYRDLISGVEFTATNPTEDGLAALYRQAVDASLAIVFAQDGETPRKLTLANRQSLYHASQA